MKVAGFDIGTTTVCGIVMDAGTGAVISVRTLDNDSGMMGESYERLQDPERIWQLISGMYQEFLRMYDDIKAIGLTGQMHGILYTDAEGNAVSPLFTWQDERGNCVVNPGSVGGTAGVRSDVRHMEQQCSDCQNDSAEQKCEQDVCTYAQQLSRLTGYPMATGFGITTHYYNVENHLVPAAAVKLCTIQDYIGIKLAGRTEALFTVSDAASLGCFDLEHLRFDENAFARAGLDMDILPQCEAGCVLLGNTKEGIPVAAGIGDNQASVIGSVKYPKQSVLVNVGTGAQISTAVDRYVDIKSCNTGIELRPLVNDLYLLAGSSLCGGRAYAALEQFFRKTVETLTGKHSDPLYDKLDRLLSEDSSDSSGQRNTLRVDTRFCGTRENPHLTGGITNLTLQNFGPREMTWGVLNGMADELMEFYRAIEQAKSTANTIYLIGSGNGIRRNSHLRRIFEKAFGVEMQIPVQKEEASYGAALYAMTAAGMFTSIEAAQQLISYE